ncbi:hypothetical protein [Longitalea luteola]|uniref:hypothetical protein n=1 Tax=Longitalea luteola TaxID=2812563 RepID=UPI001A957574|nr:hypothetical protein [Longitalea luteola]
MQGNTGTGGRKKIIANKLTFVRNGCPLTGWLPVAGYQLPVTSCRLPVAGLPVTG